MSDYGGTLFPWEEPDAGGQPSRPAGPAGGSEKPPPTVAPLPGQGTPDTAAPDAASDAAELPAAPAAAPGGATGESAEGGARRAEPPAQQRPVVRKEYYSISEVAELVGLPAHVLRYWESQFSVLNPSKNRSGNRVYQRKEIKLILLVKQLLHDEKYTVEGAKQKLEQLRRGGGVGAATQHALDAQMVRLLRDDLQALGELLRVDTA